MNQDRLINILDSAIAKLDDAKEVDKFREALKTELPEAIRKAAKKAKASDDG